MKRATIALLAALTLTACGGSTDEPTDTPEPSEAPTSAAPAGGPGVYELTTETGAVITIDLTGDPVDDDIVDRAERLREAVDGDQVQYVSAVVDNSKGSDALAVGTSFSVVDGAGATVDLVPVFFSINDWQNMLDDPSEADDLYNTALEKSGDEILPGAKAEVLLVADPAISDPARVFVDGVEATLQQ